VNQTITTMTQARKYTIAPPPALSQQDAIKELRKQKNYHTYEADATFNTRRLKYLLWAHSATTHLAKHFMYPLVHYCTYKTKRYRLPPLKAMVLTEMNKIFPLAQVWLAGEATPDYNWVLSKIKALLLKNSIPLPRLIATDRDLACAKATDTVFPNAGNCWVIGEGKDTLEAKTFLVRYRHAVAAETKTQFEYRAESLRQTSSAMGKYLDKEWWPYKARIVRFWAERNCYFGCHDTSTGEGGLLNAFERLPLSRMEKPSRIRLQAVKEATFISLYFRGKQQNEGVSMDLCKVSATAASVNTGLIVYTRSHAYQNESNVGLHHHNHAAGYEISSTRRESSPFEIVQQSVASAEMSTAHSQSFQELLSDETNVSLDETFHPPRSWGNAGLWPFEAE
ncbi:MULE transposase domain-containing protein, partial [Phytophthora infestans]